VKFSWMNGGREFVPKTTLGEAEDYTTFVAEAKPGAGVMREAWARQLDLLTVVLRRTDPTVTRELVGQNVPLSDAPGLVAALLQEPLTTNKPEPVVPEA
jgi:hypothetical protein